MNTLRVWVLSYALIVATACAKGTSLPNSANITSNPVPASAVSNALPASITVDGSTYDNVRWGRVTLSTVTIFHRTGVATVPLAKLPPELQKQFGYDPQKAAEWQLAKTKAATEE